jgi:hypothetical protein
LSDLTFAQHEPVQKVRTRHSTQPDSKKTRRNVVEDKDVTGDAESLLRYVSKASSKRQPLKRNTLGSSSSEDEGTVNSIWPRRTKATVPTKKRDLKSFKVIKAIEELKEAHETISPMTQPYLISPTIANNIFARQALISSQRVPTPLKASHNLTQLRETQEKYTPQAPVHTDEDSNSVTAVYRRREANTASSTAQSPISSAKPVEPDTDDEAVIRFTRRLSSAALALANKSFKSPDSGNDSGGSEQTQKSDLEEIPSRADAQTKVQADIMATLMGMMKKQQEVSDLHVLCLKIDSQRIATQWSTQPPPAMSAAELYNFTMQVLQYGAEHAIKAMQASVVHRNQLAAAGLCQNTTDPSSQPMVDFRGRPIQIQEWVHGDCKDFFSATSVYGRPEFVISKTQRPYTISLTREDMYHFLKADEVRYRSEWRNSSLLTLYFNPHGERQRNSSRFPLHDREIRERAETARLQDQQQQRSTPPQIVYYKAGTANVPGFGQPIFNIDLPDRQRLASWQMDVEQTQHEAPRHAKSSSVKSVLLIRM